MIIKATEYGTNEPLIINFDDASVTKKGPHGGARIYMWYSSKDEDAEFVDIVQTMEDIEDFLDEEYNDENDDEEDEKLLGEDYEPKYDLGEPIG